MANKISIILSSIILLIIFGGVYWLKRGDACLAQPPYYSCHIQNKFEEIEAEFNNLSGQIGTLNEASIFTIGKNNNIKRVL